MTWKRHRRDIDSPPIKKAYETIIANMMNKKGESSPKALLLTSFNAKEGKSTIARGLAVYCGRNGIRNILVDCDLRVKVMEKRLENKSPGLVDYISGEATLEKIISEQNDNSSFIPRGTETESQIKILMSKKFDDFIEQLESAYDLVLLDGPPLQEGPDSLLISKKVEGVILVVAKGVTTFKQIRDAEHLLKSSGARMSGLVLNEAGGNRAIFRNLFI